MIGEREQNRTLPDGNLSGRDICPWRYGESPNMMTNTNLSPASSFKIIFDTPSGLVPPNLTYNVSLL
jgi:hypothetical protein